MGMARVLAVGAGLVVVLGGVAVGVARSPAGQRFLAARQKQDPGPVVVIEEATLGDVTRTVSAPGSIEPRTNVQISSQVSARVLALPFREGEQVRAGDVVVRLDPQNLVAALDSARAGMRGQQARLGGAEARLITARLEFERLSSLFETGDVTRAELEAAEANYLQARSDKEALEHGIEQARAQIDRPRRTWRTPPSAAPSTA